MKKRKKIVKFPIKYIIKIEPKDIIVIVCTLIGIVLTLMQIYDWVKEHKKLDIAIQGNISTTYLNRNIKEYKNFYPLFEDYVDSDKEYSFTENCATQLMITNHYDQQVVVDKIMLEANEIKVDYSPILTFSDGYIPEEEGLCISITNTGWGDAKNLKVKVVGSNTNLEEYFKKEALEFMVPIVGSSKQVVVPFLKDSDLLGYFDDGTSFGINFEVECECDGVPEVYSDVAVFIFDGKLEYGDLGDYAQYVYGIKIDTTNENFLWEESIVEFIDQGETLILPICFFPDKSCSLKLKISFEIVKDGEKEIISTELTDMYFTVASIPGWNYKVSSPVEDIKGISEDEMQIIDSNNDAIVTYPQNSAIKIHQ